MRFVLLMLGLGLMSAASSPAAEPAPIDAVATPAEAAYARLLTLAGRWESVSAKGTVIRLTFEPIARASALVERYEAGSTVTQTVYHLDGERLLLTHYCAQGNQSRLVATLGVAGGTIPFTFLDVTNLSGADASRMVGCEFVFDDADHFRYARRAASTC